MSEQLCFFGSRLFLKRKRLTMAPPTIPEPKKPDFDLKNLRNTCLQFIKEKYPRPVECEEYADYLQMIEEETDLEMAHRLHEMANKIEHRIYDPQKKIIQEVYGR